MVCGAFGCQYGSSSYHGPPRSTHYIPSKEQKWMRSQWLKAIRRENYDPAAKAFLCDIHFLPGDFLPPEKNLTKAGKPKKSPTLKPSVIPSQYMKGKLKFRTPREKQN